MKNQGQFRFTYFTNNYIDTIAFYEKKLGFNLEHFWDRNLNDKGSQIKAKTKTLGWIIELLKVFLCAFKFVILMNYLISINQ